MAWEVIMPKMGMGMTAGKVVRWHCADGDAVTAGDLICEVESDKITAEITADVDGVLTILAPQEAEVSVGQAIGSIEPAEGAVMPERPATEDEQGAAIPVEANGITLYAQESGHGAPLILIHGLASSMALWGGLELERLSGRRVIAYDLRGHGLSDKPPGAHTLNKHTADLLGLMDALGADSVDLAGQSLGGLIALHTAVSRPDRVRRVAVMNCAATFPVHIRERFFELASDASFNGLEYAAAVMTELSFSAPYAKANPGLLEATRQGIQRGDTASFIAAARMVAKVDISANLPGVQAPTLVFAADADALVPPAAVEALCDGLPQATLVPLKNCGHAAPLEQPAAIVEGLASFLE